MNATLAFASRNAGDLFAAVARDLEETERILKATLNRPEPGVARLIHHLSHYRGKRLRPALLLLTAQACGAIRPAHHLLAAVVEMIHTATLVHDDVLDNASTRRHVATVNAGWGNQASVLLGDYLFTHAFHLSSTLDDVRACRIIGDATNKLCCGELHQVVERGNLELGEDAYFAIIDGKTAELTACACRLGALYADADSNVVESMSRFGRNLGLAFQIADDLLDLVGDERSAGKSLGTDLDQRKLTLPVIHYLAQADAEQKQAFFKILDAAGNHKRETLRPLFEAAGSIDYARRRAEELADLAAAELQELPPSEARAILEHLTLRVVHRDC